MVKRIPNTVIGKIRRYGDIRNYARAGRIKYLAAAGLFLLSVSIPTLQSIVEYHQFKLSDAAMRLLDTPSQKLAKKFTYNQAAKTYHFNEKEKATEAAGNPVEMMQTQLSGKDGAKKTLYSVDMPENIEDGFKYYDNNLKISFRLIPQGQSGRGVLRDDRLIYNLSDGTSAVFTAKANGIKEDIILDKAPETDDPVWRYRLDLPKTLEARLLDDGSLGIYSADPSLFGNISYGSDADREKVMSARESGIKNYLVFGIPAPVIKETGSSSNATAKFLLSDDGKTLSVATEGLLKASYPLSVDPSVVVTSTGDFEDGNNEAGISFSTNQIQTSAQTGGLSGAWNPNTSLPQGINSPAVVAYNGYLYALTSSSNTSGVGNGKTTYYAKINTSGVLDAWVQGPNLDADPAVSPHSLRFQASAVAYNGYLYVLGGRSSSIENNPSANTRYTYYSKIGSNGSIGSWKLTTQMTRVRAISSAAVYNGYVYVAGGYATVNTDIFGAFETANSVNSVEYAKINADGTLGAWALTSSFTTARHDHTVTAYNGYFYILAGIDNSGNIINDSQYAPIAADGTLGSFVAGPAFPTNMKGKSVAANGYIYMYGAGGIGSSNQYYAQLGASGSIGPWRSNTTYTGGTQYAGIGAAVYNNYLYTVGGYISGDGTPRSDVNYSLVNPVGGTSFHAAGSTLATARVGAASVAHNGYIYSIGGHSGSAYLADVQKATLTAAGTIGSWSSAGTALTTARAFAAATVYNGYLYVSGGLNNSGVPINDMQYIPFGAAGAISGSWSTATAPGTARYKHSMSAYNGYLYIVGGDSGTPPASTLLATTRIATLNLTSGNISGYANGSSFATARRGMGLAMQGNKLYLAGGYDGTNVLADVQYATITPDSGAMSAWVTAGNSLSTARSGLGLRAYNGCLYAVGGLTDATGETSSAASVATSSVEYTCIDASNLPTTWAATTTLTAARGYHGSAVVGGTLGVAGGAANGVVGVTPVNTTANANINHGGTGENGATTAGPTFTTPRYYHGTVAYNGYLYMSGGFNINTAYDDVKKAPISNGTIGTWTAQTTLPYVLYAHTMVAYNGHMYIIGGNGPTNNAVLEATIDPVTGNIGATWNVASSMVGNHYGHGGAIYNGYLYVVSGLNASQPSYSYNNNVEYTKINADGTLQPWATTTAFVGGRTNLVAVAVNGYLYAMGGVSGAITLNTPYREAYVAKINTDGTIGTWSQTASPPFNNGGNTLVAYNGYVSFMAEATGLLHRAVVLPNGQLGDWQTGSVAFGAANSGNGGMAMYQGYAYALPGSVGGTATNTSFSAPIESIERRGTYSKLIDLGASRFLSSISYTGDLTDGAWSITYNTADNGGVLGSILRSNNMPNIGALSCLSVPTARYVWLTATLDDSKSHAIFPASAQTIRANVQDITIAYENALRSPTETRLFQGKWFSQGAIKPYDTCNN